MDLIIISYNTRAITLQSIETALTSYPELNIIVVDNASTDDTIDQIKKNYPKIKIIYNTENLGYSKAVNIGVKHSSSNLVAIANSDVYYQKHSLQILEETLLQQNNFAAAGAQQIYPDGTWQYSYGFLPSMKLGLMEIFLLTGLSRLFAKNKFLKNKSEIKFPEYLDGALIVVKKEIFDLVGGFDESYFFYTEEADFCKKIKEAKFQIVFQPKSQIIHLRGGSSGHFSMNASKAKTFIGSKMIYCRKHLSKFETFVYVKCEVIANFNKYIAWSIIHAIKGNKFSESKKNWFKIMLKTWVKQQL